MEAGASISMIRYDLLRHSTEPIGKGAAIGAGGCPGKGGVSRKASSPSIAQRHTPKSARLTLIYYDSL
jgi:hypothetical protein